MASSHELLLRYGDQERVLKLEQAVAGTGWTSIAIDAAPVTFIGVSGLIADMPYCFPQSELCGVSTVIFELPSLMVSSITLGIDIFTGAIYTVIPGEVKESLE